jgi:hypothetical protein
VAQKRLGFDGYPGADFALGEGAEHGLPGMNFYKTCDAQEIFDWLKKVVR